jgi:ABC-2 type transport system permease protein
MRASTLLSSRDLSELARSRAFRLVAAGLGLLALGSAAGIAAIAAAPGSGGPEDRSAAAMLLYFATLLPFLAFVWAFAGPTLAKEKASGHLETLLATPLSARAIWAAKSATIAVPGLLVCLGTAALAVAAAAVAAAAGGGNYPLSAQAILACALGNPLLFSGLCALTVALALRASPDAAIAPSFVIGFGAMAIVPIGAGLGLIDLSSWAFVGTYLAAGALEWLIVLALERGTTKERIVLSGRED